MQRNNFILGVALLVVATTLAITITVSNPTADDSSSKDPSASAGSSDALIPESPASSFSGSSGRRASPADSSFNPRRTPRGPEVFTVAAPADHPEFDLLVRKAQAVELEAQKQLDRLTGQLELSREQQRRLYPILARSSRNYDPAMIISGLPPGATALTGPAGTQELNDLLEPPQKDELVEDAMADIAIWQGIIAKLSRRLDEQTPNVREQPPVPATPGTPATRPSATDPVPSAPRGRGNLFDQIQPQR